MVAPKRNVRNAVRHALRLRTAAAVRQSARKAQRTFKFSDSRDWLKLASGGV